MEGIIRWFVNNKVVSNLLMMLIIITGATTIPMLKMEVFPEIDLNIINVTTVYPGATPTDIEEAICIKIEERLQGLDGVKKVTSNASENVGNVNIEIISGQDPNEMLDKVKAEVYAIDTFPENVSYIYSGAWGTFPFFQSGNIIISDRTFGLFFVNNHHKKNFI